MNSKTKILIGILAIGIILISGWWIWKSQPVINEKYCEQDSDCGWVSCCHYNYKCMRKDALSCPTDIICLAYSEPMPQEPCVCVNNKCTVQSEKQEISEQEVLGIANQLLQSMCDTTFPEIKKVHITRTFFYNSPKEDICPGIKDYMLNHLEIWMAEKTLVEEAPVCTTDMPGTCTEGKLITAIVLVGLNGEFICGYALDHYAAPGILPLEDVCEKELKTKKCDEKCKKLGFDSGVCREFYLTPGGYEKRCKFEEGEVDIGHTPDCNPFEFNEEGEPVGGGGKACCCRAEEQEVSLTIDKTEYWQEEAVKITITNNGKEPIYLSPYTILGGYLFSISRFINGSWQEISLSCGPTCVCSEDNFLGCPQYIHPAPYLTKFKSPLTSGWQQTRCVLKNEMCGNKSYAKGVFEQVETGRYKIKFCYWDKKDIDLTKEVSYAPQDKKRCIEKEFTIK